MDRGHLRHLKALLPPDARCRVHLFLEVLPAAGPDVADPFYGDDSAYEAMLDAVEAAAPAWVDRLRQELTAQACCPGMTSGDDVRGIPMGEAAVGKASGKEGGGR